MKQPRRMNEASFFSFPSSSSALIRALKPDLLLWAQLLLAHGFLLPRIVKLWFS
jgi:hypothetical protein